MTVNHDNHDRAFHGDDRQQLRLGQPVQVAQRVMNCDDQVRKLLRSQGVVSNAWCTDRRTDTAGVRTSSVCVTPMPRLDRSVKRML